MRAPVNTGSAESIREALRKVLELWSGVVDVKKVGRTKGKVRFPQPSAARRQQQHTKPRDMIYNNPSRLFGLASHL
jgi:hypothetical protein